MVKGVLEVLLINARGLGDTDFLGRMDPYVLIQYQNQQRKSTVAQGGGRRPEWNESHTFLANYPSTNNEYKLSLKIMDKDTFTADDFVGEAVIYVKDLFLLGAEKGKAELHPAKYCVVGTDGSYCGELQVGVIFTPRVEDDMDGEEVGGWKQSDN
ncbi:Elicitor-responsive protein [Thalictrum thalictroides]|uniref:Elicitor-responsive protein n=1 Tax=Thalictrum thalictroides TaxID=46969 RepID=A0A7J6UVW2_THATH|nr:Elicitor-responsive protein [Thalictrum thalictroides]